MQIAGVMTMPNIVPPAECITVSSQGRRPTILIAEDAADTRLIICRTLEFENYRYLQAVTGEEALEKAIRYRPQILLLDLMLPKLNGFQVLMRLKHLNLPTKVCIMSAIDREDFIQRALDFGAADYIVKPVFSEAINHKVKALLGEPETESYFRLPCSLTGKIMSDRKSHECQIKNLTEVSLILQTDASLRNGDVVSVNCPALNRLLNREIPLYLRLRNMRRNRSYSLRSDFEGEIIGLSESQRQRLRAEIIRGKFATDETLAN